MNKNHAFGVSFSEALCYRCLVEQAPRFARVCRSQKLLKPLISLEEIGPQKLLNLFASLELVGLRQAVHFDALFLHF